MENKHSDDGRFCCILFPPIHTSDTREQVDMSLEVLFQMKTDILIRQLTLNRLVLFSERPISYHTLEEVRQTQRQKGKKSAKIKEFQFSNESIHICVPNIQLYTLVR